MVATAKQKMPASTLHAEIGETFCCFSFFLLDDFFFAMMNQLFVCKHNPSHCQILSELSIIHFWGEQDFRAVGI